MGSVGIDGGDGGFDDDRDFREAHAGGLFHHGQGGGAVIGLPAIETGFADGLFGLRSGGFHRILYGRGGRDVAPWYTMASSFHNINIINMRSVVSGQWGGRGFTTKARRVRRRMKNFFTTEDAEGDGGMMKFE